MTQFKKTLSIVMLTVLLTCFCTLYLFQPASHTNTLQSKQTIKTEKAQEQNIEKKYTLAIEKLQKQNDSLQALVNQHKSELAQADKKTSELESQVSLLASKVQSEPDTVKQKVNDCDSLAKKTASLIQHYDTAQSLCDETINELTRQVAVKDSADSICHDSFLQMKLQLDTSIARQQALTQNIQSLNRKISHRVIQNKLLSVGVMLLSGVATTFYIEQRK